MKPRVCQGCGIALSQPPRGRRKWCSEKCRKTTVYGGQCVDCGRATDGSRGLGKAPKRCGACRARAMRIWTRETVIEAIQVWEATYGFAPSASDWNIGQAQKRADADVRVRRYYGGAGVWPSTSTVQAVLGSWADAIEAAGFSRPEKSRYGRPGEDLANRVVREAVSRYRNGEGTSVIARDLGVSSHTVTDWLHRSGVEMRTAAEGAALYRMRHFQKTVSLTGTVEIDGRAVARAVRQEAA